MNRVTTRCSTAGGLLLAMLLSPAVMAGHGDKAKMMDTNADGMVSASEHSAGAKKMFDAMDANHDGNVTAAEMDARHQAKMKDGKTVKTGISSADKIKAIDTNGDGQLSAAEHEAGSQKKFAEMDSNKDGNLSQAEFTAGHESMAKGGR
ncbi:hypothetical protein HIV01_005320 [Lysobacter arenosi]|uniref:EF-hand domain-containing protein n=1 Tax=Lysobacter arenosi TaxID=2795387 RepID=A0ABX7RG60_9GAMM|nr:hypothetical protein [Lysobacter arenosi]QSX75929.1 hypothetical protein HIV01_005320 [Lysobacter arenosi]